jgi:hypothetical protein
VSPDRAMAKLNSTYKIRLTFIFTSKKCWLFNASSITVEIAGNSLKPLGLMAKNAESEIPSLSILVRTSEQLMKSPYFPSDFSFGQGVKNSPNTVRTVRTPTAANDAVGRVR